MPSRGTTATPSLSLGVPGASGFDAGRTSTAPPGVGSQTGGVTRRTGTQGDSVAREDIWIPSAPSVRPGAARLAQRRSHHAATLQLSQHHFARGPRPTGWPQRGQTRAPHVVIAFAVIFIH